MSGSQVRPGIRVSIFRLVLILQFSALIPLVGLASGLPTREEVYRDDRTGLIVYRDSEDPSLFWYVPVLKLLESAQGKVALRVGKAMPTTPGSGTPSPTEEVVEEDKETEEEAEAESNVIAEQTEVGSVASDVEQVSVGFFVVPTLPAGMLPILAREIPGLTHEKQLRPVIAKRISVVIPSFNIAAAGTEVSDYQYVNQPQLIRFNLPKDQLADFRGLFGEEPGIPAVFTLKYVGETRKKYIDISLSCSDLATSMNVGARGNYTFIKAQVESGVQKALATKAVYIRSKGDVPPPDVLSAVIEQCFVPSEDFRSSRDPYRGDDDSDSDIDRLKPSAKLVFRKDRIGYDQSLKYRHDEFENQDEVSARAFLLTVKPVPEKRYTVSSILTRDIKVESQAGALSPLRTGIIIQAGQQWTLQSSFSWGAYNARAKKVTYYQWNPRWSAPGSELWYRVGSGPWHPVGTVAQLGSSQIEAGELQFAMDREALWEKIPEKHRKVGLRSAQTFSLAGFRPEFTVRVSGRRIVESGL